MKCEDEDLTLPNSPTRQPPDPATLNIESKVGSLAVSTMISPNLSQTEMEMYSHDLIREVM